MECADRTALEETLASAMSELVTLLVQAGSDREHPEFADPIRDAEKAYRERLKALDAHLRRHHCTML